MEALLHTILNVNGKRHSTSFSTLNPMVHLRSCLTVNGFCFIFSVWCFIYCMLFCCGLLRY